jgi:branched-chain amino acid transport system permease protein
MTGLRDKLWHPAEIAFWLLAIGVYFAFPYRLPLLTEILILGLFALSLDLIQGYAGIVSLGHAASFGIGAYTAGILARVGWGEPVVGLLAGGLLAAVVGWATSFLLLRGRDLTRLMVTLGVAMMLYEAANKAAWLTGGADGLQGITVQPVAGLFEFDLYGRTAYLYALAVTFVLFYGARRLVGSPFGLSLRALKSNTLRLGALGAPVDRRLVTIYTIAAFYAGIAGALLTETTQFVSLDVLSFQRSADVMLVLILGGAGFLYGGFLGAVLFKLMQVWLSGLTVQFWLFWLGIVLILVVLFARNGLIGLLIAGAERLRRGRGHRDAAAEPAES